MSSLPPFKITPPLLNSSNPWATTKTDLLSLYHSPHTGAVTLRTSLWSGFSQSAATHQYTFFSTSTGHATSNINTTSHAEGRGAVKGGEGSSLNTLGYSPIPFKSYISLLTDMHNANELKIPGQETTKPFIISVTGTALEVGKCYAHLAKTLSFNLGLDLMMEINLSCPNIPDKAPPAYDGESLREYIYEINTEKRSAANEGLPDLHVGIKTPPYTYQGQFEGLIKALESSALGFDGGKKEESAISFITATNTLGSCLVLGENGKPALGSANGEGIGGMAGEALHAVALGNVRIIRGMLDASKFAEVRRIKIIGVGGVGDAKGYERMIGVGAAAVGVGTALGREGVDVFAKIAGGLRKE